MEWIAAGVVAAVAASLAIPAVVTAVGFKAGGIVVGSAAAKMMSLGAGKLDNLAIILAISFYCYILTSLLILGATPAVVSVCQSIGATGAIATSTKVAVGVAVTAVGIASKKKPKRNNKRRRGKK